VKHLFLVFCIFLCSCEPSFSQQWQNLPQNPKREFRAVWVTTVANIDYPSRKNLSTEVQKQEYVKLLNTLERTKINAVVFQVRPAADAFYESAIEPWSEYLMGKQGQAPNPFYDPLTFMIEETHKKNMEFHAWINPFRAVSNVRFSDVAPQHISKIHPEWCFKYGGRIYFNPGIPEVQTYVTKVILDITRRYDIDAIHFDDYFYPYKIAGEEIPDEETYQKYGASFTNIGDWRRNNMDHFIHSVNDSLKKIKPHIKFGISPVGAWRNKSQDPKGSDTRIGQPAYDYLYADTRKWLEMKWIDYIAPQLYWTTNSRWGNYNTLAEWWDKNSFGRHVYTGQGLFQVGLTDDDLTWNSPNEIPRQLLINRKYKNVLGSIYFSSKNLLRNPLGIADSLESNYYKHIALIPAMAWKDSIPPNAPDSLVAMPIRQGVGMAWRIPKIASDGGKAAYYVVYRFDSELTIDFENSKNILAITPKNSYIDATAEPNKRYVYAIKSYDRLHNESKGYSWVAFVAQRKYANNFKEGLLKDE
jgi:uncharacterized lipoprotein YddW (UPF0748 family)